MSFHIIAQHPAQLPSDARSERAQLTIVTRRIGGDIGQRSPHHAQHSERSLRIQTPRSEQRVIGLWPAIRCRKHMKRVTRLVVK